MRGADHPPPPGFVLVVLLDLVAALLVFWRVPLYLRWIAMRRRHWLLRVARDGLVAGLVFGLVAMVLSVFTRGEPSVQQTGADRAFWFAALGVMGMVNAVGIYLVNWGILRFIKRGR